MLKTNRLSAALRGAAIVAALALPSACRRVQPAPPPIAAASHDDAGALASLEPALPAVAGSFRGGPLLRRGPGNARLYQRGTARIELTVAYYPQGDDGYEGWVRAASDHYQLAKLNLPPGEALGFFTCTGAGAREVCDLHAQLRAGYHVEAMSGGTATRADLEDLIAAVPLSRLGR